MQGGGGAVACVFPLAFTTAPSAKGIRVFLAEKFHVDYIVVPHDPERFWFSENTRISEVLVVMRREGRAKPTKIVNLAVNPGTASDATVLAADILSGTDRNDLQIIEQSADTIKRGDWHGVQFYSPYLVDRFVDMKGGMLLKTSKLSDVATTGEPPRGVRMTFDAADSPDKHARFVRYDHKTDEVRSMHAKPNKYLIAKRGKSKQADNAWDKGGLLHIGERLRLNLTHAVAVMTDEKSIGTSWHAITPNTEDQDQWSKAMAVWLNSTAGIICLLGIRSVKSPSYVRFPIENVRNVLLPLLDEKDADTKISDLVKVYDRYCDDDLGLICDANKTRIALDNGVCDALGIDKKTMDAMRTELSREPMITGIRYG